MKKPLGFLCVMMLVFTVVGNVLAMPIILSDDSLQGVFDSKSWGLDATADQMNMPEGWTLTNASGGSNMVLYHEALKDFAFGIYSLAGDELAEVFDVGDTAVAKAVVGFDGEAAVTQWYDDNGFMVQQKKYDFTGQSFGFYIATGTYGSYGSIIYSDATKNDLNNNGISGEDADIGLLVYNAAPGGYIFAGDMDNDRNFSDIVTQAESITSTPEPATALLMGVGLGLLGLGAVCRKKLGEA